MNLLTTLSALLLLVGVVLWVALALERHERDHGGLAWFASTTRRLPYGLEHEGDRDAARTLEELRAAAQRAERQGPRRSGD